MGVGEDWVAVIVEDDADVRDLIDAVLRKSGFRTVLTSNGPEGIEAVRANNPLLTTLDVNMPGMDGFAVARRLREFSNTYLIMITALADEIDVVQGFEAGADDYLVKPFRPRELRARADSMLRRPRSRLDSPTSWLDAEPPGPEPAHQESRAGSFEPPPEEPPAPTPLQTAYEPPGLRPVSQVEPPVEPTPLASPPSPARESHTTWATPPPRFSAAEYPATPRLAPAGEAGVTADGDRLCFNGLTFDQQTRLVTVQGSSVDLSRIECDLLASLLVTGRRVRSKADLVLTMRGQRHIASYFVNEADKRALEVHLANLRRKLGDDGETARFIEAVGGVGYRLAEVA